MRWRLYRRGAVFATFLLLLTLALAACGGDTADPTATTAPATQPAATATTAAEPTATTAPEPTATTAPAPTATDVPPTATTAPEPTATNVPPTATPEADLLEGDLTVFAAASLTASFTEMQEVLEAANPDLTITFNFAGSQALATQLVEGAPGDVFASANNAQMTVAVEGGVIDGEPQLFTRNRLAIVVPADNPGGVTSPLDLAKDGLKIVVANETVPVGAYTLEILDKLSADPTYGADFRAQVEANFVSFEENVNQVVTKVQLGEADAGVVYVTDVTAEVAPDVLLIEIPEEFNVIAQYPIASVVDGNSELAQAFIDFVLSDEGQAILQKYGFTALPQ